MTEITSIGRGQLRPPEKGNYMSIPKLLTTEQVAELLGLEVATVWKKAQRGQIPVIKISKRCYRYDPVKIAQWLEEKEIVPPRKPKSFMRLVN